MKLSKFRNLVNMTLPMAVPTELPILAPTKAPTFAPTAAPSYAPTIEPTATDTVSVAVAFALVSGTTPSGDDEAKLKSTLASHLGVDLSRLKNFVVTVTVSPQCC